MFLWQFSPINAPKKKVSLQRHGLLIASSLGSHSVFYQWQAGWGPWNTAWNLTEVRAERVGDNERSLGLENTRLISHTVFPAPFCPVMRVRGVPNWMTALCSSPDPKLRMPGGHEKMFCSGQS